MYRFLLTPRWLALNLLVVLLIPVMVELGFWQLHRYEAKVERNDRVSANRGQAPVPAGDLFAVGRDVPSEDKWRRATATGRYDQSREFLVRNRSLDKELGFYVVTPFVTAEGPTLLVNRGWVANASTAAARPDVPPAPTGQVTVTVRARPSETAGRSGIKNRDGLPDGQIMRIDSAELAEQLGTAVYGGYGQLAEQDPKPAEAPTALPLPDAEDTGLNLAYAVQWWIFVVALIVMWIKIVRREAADLEAEIAALDAEAPDEADGGAEAGGGPEPEPAGVPAPRA
ncbi:SURF1 family cytochrome oxidase biogenesis protein [Yinghuangia soli]|uniref:SURF1-like protein n=1 Tax=Yinghuangia soli TaxID=2908204 RepID=A0AA41Q945_9ACTN|nr:SURF1 family protein [Yinghuangia soli]MCF2533031.1 SURF1 family protein [Yinghuangia soli]